MLGSPRRVLNWEGWLHRWAKTREAASGNANLAAQLLQIQAKRDSATGWVCPPDSEWQKEFETAFSKRPTN